MSPDPTRYNRNVIFLSAKTLAINFPFLSSWRFSGPYYKLAEVANYVTRRWHCLSSNSNVKQMDQGSTADSTYLSNTCAFSFNKASNSTGTLITTVLINFIVHDAA